jgi:hypothetical protein
MFPSRAGRYGRTPYGLRPYGVVLPPAFFPVPFSEDFGRVTAVESSGSVVAALESVVTVAAALEDSKTVAAALEDYAEV